jgi:hypothetical protein
MKLSDTEKEMVAHIRKQESSMVRQRWAALLGGISVLAIDGFCIHMMASSLHKPDLNSVLFVACGWPFILFSGAMAAGIIGYVRANWNGKPERQLLLRLIDELQDHDA